MSWENYVLEITGKLREARIAKGISLETLAAETETELAVIKRIEGGNGSITLDKLLLIADFLDFKFSDEMDDCRMDHIEDQTHP